MLSVHSAVADPRTADVSSGVVTHYVLFVILDRVSRFTKQFKDNPKSAGVNVILSPFQAPNCNAFAERFVLSTKSECLNRMIFFGEGSLRRACSSFLEHYHSERTHQGRGYERIERVEYGGREMSNARRDSADC